MAKLRLMFSACALQVSNWSYDVLCMWEWTSDTIWLLDILSNWSLKPKTSQGVTPTLSPKHLDTGRSTPMPVSPQLAVPRCSKRFPFCGPALVQSDGWITHGYPGTSTVCHGKLAMCRRFIPYLYHIYTILNYRQYLYRSAHGRLWESTSDICQDLPSVTSSSSSSWAMPDSHALYGNPQTIMDIKDQEKDAQVDDKILDQDG